MKTAIAIGLIISGTVLIAAPYISNAWGVAHVSGLIAQVEADVNIKGGLPPWYDGGAFTVGLLMICVAVIASLRRASQVS